ncbi:hypothetical protein M409DRAFT_22467 [Zasmidium cellare ATCC 36951]|uniref:N-acetyltransferase domain-containing protein n=1 Tax=Zasmidium cellare ATCC 36951 TaxID=1080233 RepID=A0A6A6CMQ8_ZASCE|nr:uncharacterized protein M409DRAFT_22467 [Zasmidium cellare ATCC 36951]KAF2167029.1 hypothetical protein M409DRAFT_22467 [Zasmidium cellare ATCC 36951]
MSPTPISISRAVPADIVNLVTIRRAAYATDRLHALGLPSPMTPSQKQAYLYCQLATMEIRFTLSNRYYFKAVDSSSGKTVGFSCWNALEGDSKGAEGGEGPVMPSLPGFVDSKVFDEIGKKFKEAKERIVGGRGDFWYLQAMIVSPSHQKRGMGTQLLKHGLRELVDRDGLDCYLEASEVAARLYERNGFVP